jgi:hypothetical protein
MLFACDTLGGFVCVWSVRVRIWLQFLQQAGQTPDRNHFAVMILSIYQDVWATVRWVGMEIAEGYQSLRLNNAIHLFSLEPSVWLSCVYGLRGINSWALNASIKIPPGTRNPRRTRQIVWKHFIISSVSYPFTLCRSSAFSHTLPHVHEYHRKSERQSGEQPVFHQEKHPIWFEKLLECGTTDTSRIENQKCWKGGGGCTRRWTLDTICWGWFPKSKTKDYFPLSSISEKQR